MAKIQAMPRGEAATVLAYDWGHLAPYCAIAFEDGRHYLGVHGGVEAHPKHRHSSIWSRGVSSRW